MSEKQRKDEAEHIVIENHHQPIIDYRTFAITRSLRKKRTTSHYRGVKKNDNVYSGFMECGDCGSPMFATSRSDMKPAYTCGTYHRRGRSGCTSHHIRVNRAAKTAMDVFRDILEKEKLERNDLELVISKIKVYEDHLEILLGDT